MRATAKRSSVCLKAASVASTCSCDCATTRGRRVLLVLLPLTSAEGSQGYLQRLRILFAERFGQARELESLGVRIRQYELDAGNDRQALGHFLFNECGLNDQQVAV